MASTPIELRDYQRQALEDLRATVQQGVRRVVLQAPTGAGKTKIAAEIVEGAIRKNNRMAFVCPAISLIDQTVEAFYDQGIRGIGVIQANHCMTDWAQPVQVCSIQTIASRKKFPDAQVVVVDECVVGDTKIATPLGEKRIREIKVGDCVYNATGVGIVQAISSRRRPVITVGLSNGRDLTITKNHPIFTEWGWKQAGTVAKRSLLFSQQAVRSLWKRNEAKCGIDRKEMERTEVLFNSVCPDPGGFMEAQGDFRGPQTVCGMRRDIQAMDRRGRGDIGREKVEHARYLLAILREEIQEPNVFGEIASESKRDFPPNWSSTEGARRERASINNSSAGIASSFGGWMEAGNCRSDENGTSFGLPELLQNRYRESGFKDWNRGGWRKPCGAESKIGCEEGPIFGDVRVENIQGNECECIEDVFNIRVSGHPSYFANGVLVHNCHTLHKAHKEWLSHPDWQRVPFIGLSATPWSRGLGKFFQTLIVAATTKDLIAQGFLSPFKVFATGHPDLSKVKTVAGDYHEGELSTAMQEGSLTADIVRTWKERWGKSNTLCFAVDRAHAQMLQQRFEEAGVRCGYQDANTPDAERREIKRKFASGEYQVVTNIGTLTTGVDWPVSCLILARPTKSEILFTQIIGRALRTAPGKDYALILDHSDTTQRLGFVSDIHHERLDDGKPAAKAKTAEAKGPPLPCECKSCGVLMPKRLTACPNCGHKPEIASGYMERDGELVEIKPHAIPAKGKRGARRVWTMQEKATFLAELKAYAIKHGYKDGWASYKFKERHACWPDWSIKDIPPAEFVGAEVTMYVRSRAIAYAKGMAKRAAQQPDPRP
jgi:DNA repair protein RadD